MTEWIAADGVHATPAPPQYERVTAADPLPSENVTNEGGAGFVLPAERIATFDHDGWLWSEQPAT